MNHSTSVWFSGRRGFGLVLLVYLAATLPLVTRYPAPWVDEGWIGEVAAQIARGHAPGNPSHGTLFHFNDRIYWMPPLYFYLLGGWFSLSGVSLLAGRLMNVMVGLLTTGFLYDTVRRRLGNVPAFVSCLVFALDTFAWKAHRTIRFESVLTLLAVLLARFLVEANEDRRAGRNRALPWIGAGIASGLIVNTHPLGALFVAAAVAWMIVAERPSILKSRGPWLFAATVLLLVIPYAIYCFLDRSSGFANFLGQNSFHVDLGKDEGPAPLREWRRYAAFYPSPWRAPAGVLAFFVLALGWKERREPLVGLSYLVIGVAALGMALLPNKTLLYLVTLLPFLGVIAGALWRSGARPARFVPVLLILAYLPVNAGILWKNRDCDPEQAFTTIRARLSPEDRVAGTFVTWWAVQPLPFHEFSRGATLEAVDRFGPSVILLGDRQWEQEKTGRFGPLDRDLHERFEKEGIPEDVIEDSCLGRITLHRMTPGEDLR